MAEIKLQEGESIENALRRFKRKVQQEDIIKDIKKHSFYLKPGDSGPARDVTTSRSYAAGSTPCSRPAVPGSA